MTTIKQPSRMSYESIKFIIIIVKMRHKNIREKEPPPQPDTTVAGLFFLDLSRQTICLHPQNFFPIMPKEKSSTIEIWRERKRTKKKGKKPQNIITLVCFYFARVISQVRTATCENLLTWLYDLSACRMSYCRDLFKSWSSNTKFIIEVKIFLIHSAVKLLLHRMENHKLIFLFLSFFLPQRQSVIHWCGKIQFELLSVLHTGARYPLDTIKHFSQCKSAPSSQCQTEFSPMISLSKWNFSRSIRWDNIAMQFSFFSLFSLLKAKFQFCVMIWVKRIWDIGRSMSFSTKFMLVPNSLVLLNKTALGLRRKTLIWYAYIGWKRKKITTEIFSRQRVYEIIDLSSTWCHLPTNETSKYVWSTKYKTQHMNTIKPIKYRTS